MPLKILHLACPGKNTGDNLLIMGVRNLFKDYKLELKNLRNTILTKEYIHAINKTYNGIIIGGGGLLHCPDSIRKKKNNTSGTLIEIDTNNLKFIKIPIIFYGIGYNVFNGETDLPEISKNR